MDPPKVEPKDQKEPQQPAKLLSMEFEDILLAVGDYGRYQKRFVYLFLIPTSTLLPFFCMNIIFMLSTPEHWCKIPDSLSNMSLSDVTMLTRPWEINTEGHKVQSSCNIYDINYDSVLRDINEEGHNVSWLVQERSVNWNTTKCDQGWQYDKTFYKETVSTTWNLVCDDTYLISLIFTLSNAGSAIGTPIFGSLSDKIGRRLTYIITAVIALVTSILTVVVSNLTAFIVVRAVNGSLLPSVFQLPYLILLEIVSPEMRTKMNGLACVSWVLGLASMPLIAYLCGDWIIFGWVCAVLTVPYLLYFKFLPESPRWLMSQGRYEEACVILNKVAKTNGKDVTGLDLIGAFKKSAEAEKLIEKETYVSPLELIRKPVIRKRFFILSLSWVADSMCYYGFHINVSHLYGNEFMNFFLLAVVELPSYLFAWYLIETKLGRRWCNAAFLLIMGLACLMPMVAPNDTGMLTTVASLVGKFGCSASYMVMYQQAAEIFPTPLRASGMGIAGTVAAIITVCTPYIIYLGKYNRNLPFTIMGLIGVVAGIAALFLPETLHENLPQTLQDGEDFGKDQKFFSFAQKNKHSKQFNMEKTNMEAFA